MSDKPKRWHDMVLEKPKLTKAQAEAVLDIVDYHLSHLVSDHPPVDGAHYDIQQDIATMTEADHE